jgi:hypothetical protein
MEEQPDAADVDGAADVDEAADPSADDAPRVEPTGVASVDAALERLGDVAAAPLDEHVEIFDEVQRKLHDALAELDDEQ